MSNDKTTSTYKRVIVLIIMCCGVIFLGANVWTSNGGFTLKVRQQERYLLAVRNETKSFNVVGIEKTDSRRVKVTLKNDYAKKITAFVISPGKDKNTAIRYDFALSESDDGIVPGATYTTEVMLSGPTVEPDQSAPEQLTLYVRAVILQDKTSDGDSESVRRALDNRLGHKKQIGRILALLQLALNSPDTDLLSVCANLKSKIANLPVHSERGVSAYYIAGLHNAKENAIRYIQQLEERQKIAPHTYLREELIKIKERHERNVSRLATL